MSHDSPVKKYNLLYVDDEEINLRLFERAFRFDFEIFLANSGKAALEILQQKEITLLIADQKMPGMTGLELLKIARDLKPQTIRIILSAYSESEILLQAIQEGHVYDYILKPWKKEKLQQRLEQAVHFYQSQVERQQQLKQRLLQVTEELEEIKPSSTMACPSAAFQKLLNQIQKVAASDATVLIRGESGSGKELVARTLHEQSSRCHGPLVRVNASALSESVLESELFGHEKGAFTGATQTKKGRFEMAEGGTLFLDEVGDLPLSTQVKLLRVLQEREFERVGGTQTIQVNLRLIAATHRPLELLIEQGKFREDLFYRLNVVPLQVPPLRERIEDLPNLLEQFLKQFNRELGKRVGFSSHALQKLKAYPWPGNIREFKNYIERCLVLAEPDEVFDAVLPEFSSREIPLETVALKSTLHDFRDQNQKEQLAELISALQQARGNLAEAARMLKIPRTTLFSRMKKLGLV